jgi:hypothetical protein
MALEIRTEITIAAAPKSVWAILTNFNNYPSWNPFIKSIQGEVKLGEKIIVLITPPDAKSMTFKPKILVYNTSTELRWLGHLLFPGLFDGNHRFQLLANPYGSTTFVQSERFTGILVPLFKSQLCNNTRRGFEAMNMQLKKTVEMK